MDEPLIKTEEEADELVEELMFAFGHVLMISQVGGLGAGTKGQAALFADLLARMHHYKMEKATETALVGRPAMAARMQEGRDLLWPKLQAKLDADIAEAITVIRKAKGEDVH